MSECVPSSPGAQRFLCCFFDTNESEFHCKKKIKDLPVTGTKQTKTKTEDSPPCHSMLVAFVAAAGMFAAKCSDQRKVAYRKSKVATIVAPYLHLH